jgi:hypothetical protein
MKRIPIHELQKRAAQEKQCKKEGCSDHTASPANGVQRY